MNRPRPSPAPVGQRRRISADSCWPLRDAAGRTWSERRRLKEESGS